nr:MAG TPA: hypothetical protein [Caudoviricetes sp.]
MHIFIFSHNIEKHPHIIVQVPYGFISIGVEPSVFRLGSL